jgi:hypothetical protein
MKKIKNPFDNMFKGSAVRMLVYALGKEFLKFLECKFRSIIKQHFRSYLKVLAMVVPSIIMEGISFSSYLCK